jgi:hypothetical protein
MLCQLLFATGIRVSCRLSVLFIVASLVFSWAAHFVSIFLVLLVSFLPLGLLSFLFQKAYNHFTCHIQSHPTNTPCSLHSLYLTSRPTSHPADTPCAPHSLYLTSTQFRTVYRHVHMTLSSAHSTHTLHLHHFTFTLEHTSAKV